MIAAIVLAAGRSERMGYSKPLLSLGQTTFLGAILATIETSRVEEVRVVLGGDAEEIRSSLALPEAVVVVNPDSASPMMASVKCGIRALPLEVKGFLLWPVDHPLVRPETVDLVVDAFEQRDAAVVVPRHGGRRGHPTLFAARLIPELLGAEEAVGARQVVHAHESEVYQVAVDDPGVVTDINTPETYRKMTGRRLPS